MWKIVRETVFEKRNTAASTEKPMIRTFAAFTIASTYRHVMSTIKRETLSFIEELNEKFLYMRVDVAWSIAINWWLFVWKIYMYSEDKFLHLGERAQKEY